ncbi:redoxin domain-containing protein, partial [Escherichia coli]|nr:redoxin domain-containing protein [Escherichia coli]
YGEQRRLSDLQGKVILLDFWTAAAPASRMNNEELKERYAAWKEKGFEIYQVSGDTDKALWVNMILEQKIPWITVCDFKSAKSKAFIVYNVKSV